MGWSLTGTVDVRLEAGTVLLQGRKICRVERNSSIAVARQVCRGVIRTLGRIQPMGPGEEVSYQPWGLSPETAWSGRLAPGSVVRYRVQEARGSSHRGANLERLRWRLPPR